MKKILLIFLIIYPLNLVADERVYKLNKLFNDLRIDNKSISAEVEQKIWKIWSTHPNNERLTNMLAEGSDLVNNQKLNEAIVKFSDVIKMDPNWAEAWNKRATVFYLIGEYPVSYTHLTLPTNREV